MIPHHRFKLGGDYRVTKDFKIGADLLVVGSQYFAGDASNQFEQLPAYAVVDADASYQVTTNVQVYLRVKNVFDNHYYTYGTFFDTTRSRTSATVAAAVHRPALAEPGAAPFGLCGPEGDVLMAFWICVARAARCSRPGTAPEIFRAPAQLWSLTDMRMFPELAL